MQATRDQDKAIRAWCFYDWANSAFATTIMAAVLPIFYANVAGAELPGHQATAYWGYTTAIALALAAILSPIAGAAADAARARKKMLVAGALIGAAITGLLATVSHGQWLKASLVFIAAQLFFVIANVAYDSLLPHVARGRNLDRISTRAYALGYLGGGLLLAINMAMILFPEKLGIPNAGVAVRLTFVTVTVWWAVFTIPLIRHVREPGAGTGIETEPRTGTGHDAEAGPG
ncbi:MAG: MFS transporter, partial [Gemmatimonadetes bacterium]|nr:MFS transporter [Gemmatimonadota bacterium]